MPPKRSTTNAPLPTIQPKLMGGFRVFNRRYLRKHFHVVGVQRQVLHDIQLRDRDSIVVYANHASWWDPLVAIFLADTLFPGFAMYAPIDAEAFEKYRIFGKMGFYPIDTGSLRGAANFLKTSKSILAQPGASIWITPEGRFADVRDHSAEFMPGLAHLAATMSSGKGSEVLASDETSRVWFLSLALEYTFWEERTPEILGWFGEPLSIGRHDGPQTVDTKAEWDRRLQASLRGAQEHLAQAAMAREPSQFEVLLKNKSGSFALYDWFRRARARLGGASLEIDHSNKFGDAG